ncbi:class I SAM-dependent methyltransferase [Nocardioides sp. YIM 152588]|uniref:class I SAM-dependent methyltransferase n=1 Tax=Nocardioides sp. YIM 152588 TaxID=3158259 RepID=UPI0032E443BD
MLRWIQAALYDRSERASEDAGLRDERHRLLAGAHGVTVEVGAGTGLNLAHYSPEVDRLVLVEPDRHMARRLRRRAAELGVSAEVLDAMAEDLPLPTDSVDTAVVTFVLCSVPDPAAALREVARVLRPGGSLLFAEHVRSAEPELAARQDREPFPYRWLGCHPNRETLRTITESPLVVEEVAHGEVPRAPELERPMVLGVARLPER